MSSWLRSLFSPARNWKWQLSLSKRLRTYRFALSSVLWGVNRNENDLKLYQRENEERYLKNQSWRNLEELERIIRYNFKDRSLLQQAFTHLSFHEVSYERLEYVGDSVLNLLIAKHQFCKYPGMSPGLLTVLRAANVDTEKLARVAVKHNFHKYLRYRMPVLDRKIQAFITALPDYPLHSHGLINAPKILADVVESTIGAIYIDSDFSIDTTWKVAEFLLEPIITPDMLETNPVKKLMEISQKYKLKVQVVDLWTKQGTYEVFVDNQLRGRAKYRAKKDIAMNRAANEAYNQIVSSLGLKGEVNIGG